MKTDEKITQYDGQDSKEVYNFKVLWRFKSQIQYSTKNQTWKIQVRKETTQRKKLKKVKNGFLKSKTASLHSKLLAEISFCNLIWHFEIINWKLKGWEIREKCRK